MKTQLTPARPSDLSPTSKAEKPDRRGFHALRPLHACAFLLVLGVFVWLNLSVYQTNQVAKIGPSYRSIQSFGFPIPWWQGGSEYTASSPDKVSLSLTVRDYSEWKPMGIALGAGTFLLCMAAVWLLTHAAVLCMDAARITRSEAPRARFAISPLTGLLTMLILGLMAYHNLQRTTLFDANEQTPVKAYRQTMGWPMTVYTASDPAFDQMFGAGRLPPQKNVARYLDEHPNAWFYRAHWHGSNIVINVITSVLLIYATAFSSEHLLRRRKSPARLCNKDD